MLAIRSSAFAAVKRWDAECAAALSPVNSGPVSRVMFAVGALGAERIFLPGGVIFAVWALFARGRRAALIVLAVTLVTGACNRSLKFLVPRRRPPMGVHRGGSFPSGHTMAAVAVYGIAADVVCGFRWPAQPLVAMGALLFGTVIGFTRVGRAMHWASDVIAGLVLGLVIFMAASAVLLHPALK
jgi:undecaprenyl-diphosphatase